MSNDKPTSPAPRLVGFHVRPEAQLPAPLHRVGLVHVDQPQQLDGWGVEIRGATMFLVSPPGWKQGTPATTWKKNGERTIFGPISLVNVTLIWQGASIDACDKVQRYSLPEMRTAAKQVPEGEPAIDPKYLGDP